MGAAAGEQTALDTSFSRGSGEDGPQGRKAGRDDTCGHFDAGLSHCGRERVGWVGAAVGEEDGEAICGGEYHAGIPRLVSCDTQRQGVERGVQKPETKRNGHTNLLLLPQSQPLHLRNGKQ